MASDPDPITAAKRFLIHSIRDKPPTHWDIHPWRNSWEFVYFHSLRVDAICQKITALEAPDLPADEALALRLAAILHDVGRLDDRPTHAALGAQMTAGWLADNPMIAGQVNPQRVVDLVAHHSEKTLPGPDRCHALIKDADALDEIGILSVLMATSWLDSSSPRYFYELADRLRQHELPFCEKTFARLQTPSARDFLTTKQRYIEATIKQFSVEMEGATLDDPLLQEDD